MNKNTANAILLISCPDKRGITACVTDFIYKHNGNVEHADQHVDKEQAVFFMRIEWSLEGFDIDRDDIAGLLKPLAEQYNMTWKLYFSDELPSIALFVSKQLHCIADLLYRYKAGDLRAEIPIVVSNHEDARQLVEAYGIKFFHIEKTRENCDKKETEELSVLKKYNIETVVLARYMQVLSEKFVSLYDNNIINIHHSFLPAFMGAKPYEQAYKRGVKIIGATSHYVTPDLDAGPIIEQDVVRISHRDSIDDLKKKGADLEKVVLSRAVRWHLDRKLLVYGEGENTKTVVFD